MQTLTLEVNVRDLTRFSPAAIRRDDGSIDRAVVPPLLAQLRMAASNSTTQAKGGGSSEKTKIPVDAGAVDLLDRITREARAAVVQLTPAGAPDYEPAKLGVVQAVRLLGVYARANQATADHAAQLTGEWCEAIRAHLDPVKKSALPGKCPNCGISTVADFTDGELVRSHVLHAYPNSEQGQPFARCHYCSAEWVGQAELALLAAMIKEG